LSNAGGNPCGGGLVCYIGLGSNLGDRRWNIEEALRLLDEYAGIEVTEVSSLHETEPVGPPQGKYLNGAAALRTSLSPEGVLDVLEEVEGKLGRVRTVKWGPRTIDLDLLLYGDAVISSERLVVPHPLMHERSFVLGPLCEIAAGAVHPVLKKTVAELWRELVPGEPR